MWRVRLALRVLGQDCEQPGVESSGRASGDLALGREVYHRDLSSGHDRKLELAGDNPVAVGIVDCSCHGLGHLVEDIHHDLECYLDC